MKKVFVISLSLVLILFMTGSVAGYSSAEDDVLESHPNTPLLKQTGETMVYYVVSNEHYKITIPADIVFSDANLEHTAQIKAEDVTLKAENFLSVTADSEHDWEMVMHDENGQPIPNSESLSYTLSSADDTITYSSSVDEFEILKVDSGTGSATIDLKFTLAEPATVTGYYMDKLTFSSHIKPVSTSGA